VRAAAAGEAVISPELLARLLPRLRRGQPQGRHSLTAREREVLDLVAEGLTNAAIAERLVVSVHTVRNHIANLSTKLDAHSKLEALSVALQVFAFKSFRGRILLMAPVHHHFELMAWSETKIMLRFWIIAAVCSGIGFTLYQQSIGT
jgi:DNA-binding CsgD family transcriptional regulator